MMTLARKMVMAAGMALFLSPIVAAADVVAYSAPGDKHLFIEAAPQLGSDAYLVQFSGVTARWTDKVIKTKKTAANSGDRYGFEYEMNLSSGKVTRTYQMLVGNGDMLVNGTVTPVMTLYYEGGPKDGLNFTQDVSLTKSSQGIRLAQQYASNPYQPEMH